MIVKRSGGNFTPAPAGTWAAVCVDVVDLGMVVGYEGKTQHKIKIVWQIEETMPDGKPYQVQKRYTPSLHEKASLRKDLEAWRGRAFTDEELDGWDLDNILGAGCLLCVVQVAKNDQVYANIQSLMRLPKSMHAPTPRDYERVKDRSVDTSHEPTPSDEEPAPESYSGATDDDIPFSQRPLGGGEQVNNEEMFQMRADSPAGCFLQASSNGRWSIGKVQGLHQTRREGELSQTARAIFGVREDREAGVFSPCTLAA